MLAFDDRWIWDFWLADDGERYHVFYLQAPRSLGDPDRRHDRPTVGHAVSHDLVDWQVLPDALGHGPSGAFDDLAIWTGSVIRDGDGWSMLYTGRSTVDGGLIQRIGRAVSDDLLTWRRDATGPVLTATPPYERLGEGPWAEEAWRDPWLRVGEDGRHHALITARLGTHPAGQGRGVIAHASSDDLVTWRHHGPITEPGEFEQLEVPQVERVGDRWILVFSCLRPEVAPARQARRPDEPGGSFWVEGPSALGPFDVTTARPFPEPDLYSMKIVRRRDGRWVALGFIDRVDGVFVGALSDPRPVAFD